MRASMRLSMACSLSRSSVACRSLSPFERLSEISAARIFSFFFISCSTLVAAFTLLQRHKR